MFSLTLLDAFTTAKGPGDGGVSFADFVAGIAAAGFDGIGGRWGAEALSAVVRVKVGGFVLVAVFVIRERT
jgi:hypothetical protein